MADANFKAGARKEAPPLTLENVLKEVKGLNGQDLYKWLNATNLHPVDINTEKAVEEFLHGRMHYQPSWRALIFALDGIGKSHANRIRHYAEPVQDPTLTTDSVAESMESLEYIADGFVVFDVQRVIPPCRLREIQQRCSTKRDIAHECASYYIHCHPQSSWTHLTSHLYRQGEFAAVEKLKPFLPLRDLTITTEKLVELFATMEDAYVKEHFITLHDQLDKWLDLPESKVAEIKRKYHSPSQRRDAYLDLYVTDHPCPSWRQVAQVLRDVYLRGQARVVESTYVQDASLSGQNFYMLEDTIVCEADFLRTLERCHACKQRIQDRVLRACGQCYHPSCFRCVVCGQCLDGVPYIVSNSLKVYCIHDYHKKHAPKCAVCGDSIIPRSGRTKSLRVTASGRSYHVDCYKCEDCGRQLASKGGDEKCYPLEGHLYCRECNAARVYQWYKLSSDYQQEPGLIV